ncbi:MAG: hypothetical protein GXO31_09115 [Epsilonproteobacteria bacterium]|nr:hypothetical protein [Campylobacterota bacterium]
MLKHYLKAIIKDIDNLIDLTKEDIEEIKKANHEKIFNSSTLKDELVIAFENKKSIIDKELLRIVQENPGKDLSELLDQETKSMLEEMKNKLTKLKKINKEYAQMVIAVSEFYNSLLDEIFPRELEGYQKVGPKKQVLFNASI